MIDPTDVFVPVVTVLIRARDHQNYRSTEEGEGATEQEAVVNAMRSLVYNTGVDTHQLEGWLVCTSDNPGDHQGDTCPIHEDGEDYRVAAGDDQQEVRGY